MSTTKHPSLPDPSTYRVRYLRFTWDVPSFSALMSQLAGITPDADMVDAYRFEEKVPAVTIVNTLNEDGTVTFGWSALSSKDVWDRKKGIRIAAGRLRNTPVTVPIVTSEKGDNIKETFRQAVLDGKFGEAHSKFLSEFVTEDYV